MTHVAISARFDEGRQRLLARALHRTLRGLTHRENIHAINEFCRNFVSARFLRNVLNGHRPLERGAHPVAIVFADVDAGDLPQLGHVQRFMEGALVNGGFAKEAERDLIRSLVFTREGQAGSERNLAANNRVSAEKIDLHIKQVHRAAFAARTARGFPIKLCHHSIRRNALRDRLSMLAVARNDIIVLANRRDGADADCLLTDVQMAEAANLAQVVRLGAFLFKAPTQKHLPIQLDKRIAVFLENWTSLFGLRIRRSIDNTRNARG